MYVRFFNSDEKSHRYSGNNVLKKQKESVSLNFLKRTYTLCGIFCYNISNSGDGDFLVSRAASHRGM